MKTIQARLGHTKTATTLDLYGHLLPGAQDQAVDAIANIVNGTAGGKGR